MSSEDRFGEAHTVAERNAMLEFIKQLEDAANALEEDDWDLTWGGGFECLGRITYALLRGKKPEHEHDWTGTDRICGVRICQDCEEHEGLARCFCGWNLEPGERLEDDVEDY